jgi:hypothetical protein
MGYAEPGGLKVPISITAADSMVVSFKRNEINLEQAATGWPRTAPGQTRPRPSVNAKFKPRFFRNPLPQRVFIVLPSVATDCNVFPPSIVC